MIRLIAILALIFASVTCAPLNSTEDIHAEREDKIPPQDQGFLIGRNYTKTFQCIAEYYVRYTASKQKFFEARKEAQSDHRKLKDYIESLGAEAKQFAEETFYDEFSSPDPTDHTRSVTLIDKNEKFGIAVVIGKTISNITAGSPAAFKGVQPGDEIVSIDRTDSRWHNLEKFDVSHFAHHHGIVTIVLRQSKACIKKHNIASFNLRELGVELIPSTTRAVCINPGREGFIGLKHYGTSIVKVKEGGPAALQGVERGDQLIAVDGVVVETSSEEEISALIGKAKASGSVSLVLRHNPERLRDLERRRTST